MTRKRFGQLCFAVCLALVPLSTLSLFGQSAVGVRPAVGTKVDRAYSITKGTTFFTGPLKADGSVDFLAAVNHFYSEGVTETNNAARIIVPLLDHAEMGWVDNPRRERLLLALGLEPSDHPIGQAFKDVGPYFQRSVAKIQEFEKDYSQALERPWTADEFPNVAKWLADNAAALDQISKGAAKEKYFVPWVIEGESDALFQILLDHVQAARGVARAYQVRANLHIGEQNWEAAWNDVMVIRNLGRLIGQGPSLVEGLVGIAITSMACESAKRMIVAAEPDSVDWGALQESWNIAPVARISDSLGVTERAMLIQMICRFADNPDQAAADFQVVGANNAGEFVSILANKAFARTLHDMVHSGEVPLDDALRFVNQMYDRALTVSKMTEPADRLAALMALEDEAVHTAREGEPSLIEMFVSKPEAPATQFAKAMLTTIFPSVEAVHVAQWRTESSMCVIELALAARGLQARTGHLPSSLRELEPWVDRGVMQQPLTGDDVALRIDRGELLIYHWANNRQDDDGDFDSENPKDWGIRLR